MDGRAEHRKDGHHLIKEILRVLVTEVLRAANDLVQVRVHELVSIAAGGDSGTWLRRDGRSYLRKDARGAG